MAKRLKLKLPSLTVTQRSTTGKTSHRVVPRVCGMQDDKSVNHLEDDIDCDGCENDDVVTYAVHKFSGPSLAPGVSSALPSMHEISQKASIAAWSKVRNDLLRTAIENSGMPINQCCIICDTRQAEYRCQHCGPRAFFCVWCFEDAHCKTNCFHTGELWENGVYRPITMKRNVDVRVCSCSSDSVNFVPICCITEYGEEHNILFASCACEPLVVTLVRARLWPSTPQRPHLAFTFDLLDWVECLLLECQVSLNDFCKALYFKCRHLVVKRKDVYSALIDSFEEYRWMKVELRQLTSICPELDNGNVCPACPKKSGALVLSMDALFGLPRKKAAGKSQRDALHGHLFFGDQDAVDDYVASYDMHRQQKPTMSCSHFLAGDCLRSSSRYHSLDETAVFGSACRHEFPRLFISLRHGERLSYVVWLMEELQRRVSSDTNVYIMYDIACNLVSHLKSRGNEALLLEHIKYALPSFHAFGHSAACQVVYSPVRCEGIGLSDGEVMERMWSYLRRYSRMTKEMRPAHRIDILTHALLYYGHRTKQKLSSLLAHRWKKASEMNSIAKETLKSLVESLSVAVTDTEIEDWIKEEHVAMTSDKMERTLTLEWRSTYYRVLHSYYIMRDQLSSLTGDNRDRSAMREKVFSLDGQLADMERRFGVKTRWGPTDKEYLDTRRASLTEKFNQLHTCLWASVVKRHYLLRMKAKYADGQKIAKKLCTNITKETKRIRVVLEEYNAASRELQRSEPLIAISEVLSLSSVFWSNHRSHKSDSKQIPQKLKDEMMQALLMVRRSEEELLLLREDMLATIKYWFDQVTSITNSLGQLYSNHEDLYTRGAKSLLEHLKWEAELHYHRTTVAFSPLIDLSSAPRLKSTTCTSSEVSSDESDSEDLPDSDESDSDDGVSHYI